MNDRVRKSETVGVSRRRLLQSSGLAAAVASVPRASIVRGQATPTSTSEVPMLAPLVEAGKLPPVADRLPKNPSIAKPLETIGQYGGTLRRAQEGPEDETGIIAMARASLVEWSLDLRFEPVPGLAESWDINEDASVHTFHLREGTRWSDGESFTADDLVFFYEAVVNNPELTPAFSPWLTAGGTPVEVVKVDDYTVEFRFAAPNALFVRNLCFPGRANEILTPKHYLSQFHPDYAGPDAVQTALAASGFESWPLLFQAKNNRWTNPDLPVLGAWKISEPVGGSSSRAVAERNPYYWKVDTAGNQLPYIDRLTYQVLEPEAIVLRAANGEIDMQYKNLGFQAMPVLQDGAERGNYHISRWQSDAPWIAMYMNQSHKDPVIRTLMQDVDFRSALSLAINREEMNQLLYLGLGGIQQPCAIPADPYFVDGFGQRFTEYDPARANQLLDQVGLTQRDDAGFRLRPDGQPLTLRITTFSYETGVNSSDAYELVKQYWQGIGVQMVLDVLDSTLWLERVTGNEHDIAGYTVAGILWDIDPIWYVPTEQTTYWAPLFGIWYASRGEAGEEPPEVLLQLQSLYDQMKSTADDSQRLGLGQQILGLHDENVWMIGTVTTPFQPTVVSNDLINVLDEAVGSWRAGHEAISWFEQMAYKNPAAH